MIQNIYPFFWQKPYTFLHKLHNNHNFNAYLQKKFCVRTLLLCFSTINYAKEKLMTSHFAITAYLTSMIMGCDNQDSQETSENSAHAIEPSESFVQLAKDMGMTRSDHNVNDNYLLQDENTFLNFSNESCKNSRPVRFEAISQDGNTFRLFHSVASNDICFLATTECEDIPTQSGLQATCSDVTYYQFKNTEAGSTDILFTPLTTQFSPIGIYENTVMLDPYQDLTLSPDVPNFSAIDLMDLSIYNYNAKDLPPHTYAIRK